MKRNRLKISKLKTKILLKYFFTVAVTTIICLFLSALFMGTADDFLRFIKRNVIPDIAVGADMEYFVCLAFFAVVYLCLLLIITFIFLSRSAGFLDKGYNALSGIIEDDYEPPNLPRMIRSKHKKTETNIKNALKYRDYLAQNAEQRKNDLVVYLAHDLKTPLTSIVGYLTLLHESPDLPIEQRAKYTDITLEKAYRLEDLINEFFDITRFNLQSVVLENNHINLNIMLNQIAEEFYPVLAEKNLVCNISVTEKINLIGDADKLSRVFDNLMRNAVSYSYENAQINISAHIEQSDAVIIFKNRGDKIPAQKLDMIFEKFFRADNARTSKTGGAGLGLAIAKQIVELHGGTITAQSDDNFTSFIVRLKL